MTRGFSTTAHQYILFVYLVCCVLKEITNMRDDQEFNIQFVGFVEAYPCLYDNTRDDYHRNDVQERAWAKIAKDIGEATITECKSRWKNRRGSYTKHLKTYVPSGSGASVKCPYYLAEYMGFIFQFTKSRQAKGNVQALNNNKTNTLDEEVVTEELETEELPSTNEKDGDYENSQIASDQEQSIIEEVDEDVSQKQALSSNQQDILEKNNSLHTKKKSLPTPLPLNENSPKRKKRSHNQITLEDVNKSAYEYFEKKKEAPGRPPALTNDDAVQFLMSLLPDFKKMTDQQKRKYKVGILNLAGQILDEPVVPHTSAPLFSPTSDSYSSIVGRSSTACSTYISSQSEEPDSHLTYEDISFSAIHSPQSQDSHIPHVQYVYENK